MSSPIIILLTVFLSFNIVSSERNWYEWEMTTQDGLIAYFPWQCCQMCGGPGDEWKLYNYIKGRCIRTGRFLNRTYTEHDKKYSPKVRFWAECCFFCGEYAGDYDFVAINYDHAYCQRDERLSHHHKTYLVNENDITAVNSSARDALLCIGCRGLVGIVKEIAEVETETIRDQLYVYCDETAIFRYYCHKLVNSQLESIIYALSHNVTATDICSRFLGACEKNYTSGEIRSFGGKAARTSILDPLVDGDVANVDGILLLPPFTSRTLNEYLGVPTIDSALVRIEKTIKFLAKYRLIANERFCPDCDTDGMSLIKDTARAEGLIWRCNSCRKNKLPGTHKMSIRHSSFFEDAKIPLEKILRLACWWSDHPTDRMDSVADHFEIDKNTLTDYYNYFRDIAQDWFVRVAEKTLIGGPNSIVEIDETKLFKAKYHRGRMLARDYEWVFGGIERGTNKVFMMTVPNRTANVLLPIIVKQIAPGTTIVSDGWAAYGGITALGFHHLTVNHKYNFVDPSDPDAHTQSIEATWGALKRSLKHLYGVPESLLPSYMYQYLFRRNHNNKKICQNLLNEISKTFDLV